jgi:hypothetical protein
MTAYRVLTRIAEVSEGLWTVSATAFPAVGPPPAVHTRQHECASREQGVDFLEILVDQVRSAIEATGGEIVGVDAAE